MVPGQIVDGNSSPRARLPILSPQNEACHRIPKIHNRCGTLPESTGHRPQGYHVVSRIQCFRSLPKNEKGQIQGAKEHREARGGVYLNTKAAEAKEQKLTGATKARKEKRDLDDDVQLVKAIAKKHTYELKVCCWIIMETCGAEGKRILQEVDPTNPYSVEEIAKHLRSHQR